MNDRGYQWFLEHSTFPGAPDFGTSRSLWMAGIAIASAAGRLGAKSPVELNQENRELARRAIRWKILPSYRSSPTSPMFDSILIRDNGVLDGIDGCDGISDQFDGAVKRKIAAALAVRTMRLNGSLACA